MLNFDLVFGAEYPNSYVTSVS